MVAIATDPDFDIATFADVVPYFKIVPATLSILGCFFFITRSCYVFKRLHPDMKVFRIQLLTAGSMLIIGYLSTYPCQVCFVRVGAGHAYVPARVCVGTSTALIGRRIVLSKNAGFSVDCAPVSILRSTDLAWALRLQPLFAGAVHPDRQSSLHHQLVLPPLLQRNDQRVGSDDVRSQPFVPGAVVCLPVCLAFVSVPHQRAAPDCCSCHVCLRLAGLAG
jgi:hypothetical protein